MLKPWRETGTLYHIYPRSFQDTNGDGIGDIAGVTNRLDYLADTLGVEAIWLSPFFTSPMRDYGYDIADYRGIANEFGSLDDFRTLLDEAHARGIKVMMDLVPCHTSDQHAWFQESRSSRDNPKREYYTWKDPGPDGGPPNNWLSQSGGTSWTFDETTGQYYLHSFLSSQPDLNWGNPVVRDEMKNVVRWWFDMGVDGARVDAIWGISKDPDFADDSFNPGYDGPADQYGRFIHDRCKYGPNFVKHLRELANVCEEYDNRHMIFEFYPDDKLGDFYAQYQQVANVNPAVTSTFFMELIRSPWHADMMGDALDAYINHAVGPALPVFCIGNHDQQRAASRIGETRARALSLLNLTLPGLSVVYYGDEIGMTNGVLRPDQVRDTFSPLSAADNTRDLERTPMQWDDSAFAGFSSVEPWLPVNDNRSFINVAREIDDTQSTLSLHKELIALRKLFPALIHGSFERFYAGTGYVLAFKRQFGNQELYVLANFADSPQDITLPQPNQLLVSSLGRKPYDNIGRLEGSEAVVLRKV